MTDLDASESAAPRSAQRPRGRPGSMQAVRVLQDATHPLTGLTADFDPLLDLIGDARLVLIGEASHGTDEFYRARIEITQRLIDERGFAAVAVEADWPDAYRVNRYVRAASDDRGAEHALAGFKRFPTWMWRNTAVRDFVEWLRALNDARERSIRRVGFYGLDLYSLHSSIEAVLAHLDRIDPEAAARARKRYACFESFGEDTQEYGYAAGLGLAESCEREVVSQLVELRRAARPRDPLAADEFFYAEQNARLVKNAEEYYRAMFRSHIGSWNLRDGHMAESLEALMDHLARTVPRAKIIVWAHNSHPGDARATEVHARGELNLGQLIRERHGREAVLVGFSTYDGHVTAAREWDGPAERRRVRPALPGSIEALFHDTRIPRFLLPLRADGARLDDAAIELLRAPQPLERTAPWKTGEPEETYPSGL